jgi:hypothetical protein
LVDSFECVKRHGPTNPKFFMFTKSFDKIIAASWNSRYYKTYRIANRPIWNTNFWTWAENTCRDTFIVSLRDVSCIIYAKLQLMTVCTAQQTLSSVVMKTWLLTNVVWLVWDPHKTYNCTVLAKHSIFNAKCFDKYIQNI